MPLFTTALGARSLRRCAGVLWDVGCGAASSKDPLYMHPALADEASASSGFWRLAGPWSKEQRGPAMEQRGTGICSRNQNWLLRPWLFSPESLVWLNWP
jgi:hypothetical protein